MSAAFLALALAPPAAALQEPELGAVVQRLATDAGADRVSLEDVAEVERAVDPDRDVFPIRGPHDLGQTATNGFGGGRGHQGQDMFADCGTPVVAARGGKVREADFHGVGGNFVVVTARGNGLDYVYMHLQRKPRVRAGQTVEAGERLGEVGATGNAFGCHLHFELWTAPGWYAGGQAFDPLPRLRRWDARS
jgi:murein DD-endopeptidase MepM/ murein hydrolase activator NlpD